jgi:hypothetical protein
MISLMFAATCTFHDSHNVTPQFGPCFDEAVVPEGCPILSAGAHSTLHTTDLRLTRDDQNVPTTFASTFVGTVSVPVTLHIHEAECRTYSTTLAIENWKVDAPLAKAGDVVHYGSFAIPIGAPGPCPSQFPTIEVTAISCPSPSPSPEPEPTIDDDAGCSTTQPAGFGVFLLLALLRRPNDRGKLVRR